MSHLKLAANANAAINAHNHGAAGNGVTNDTAALQAAIDYAVEHDFGLFIPAGTYQVNGTLDMRGNGLRVYGQSRETTIIRSTASNAPIVKAGHRNQHISDLRLEYDSQRASSATNATCLELHKPYWSQYERIWCRLGSQGIALAQEDVVLEEVTTGNVAFSSTFNDMRVHGYTIHGINLDSYSGGGTGNAWNNTYISNNPTGTKQNPTGYALKMGEYDDTVINQLNLEWGTVNDGLYAMYFEECANIVINSLHIEQMDLTGANSAYIAYAGNTNLIINGTSLVHNTLSGSGVMSLLRPFSSADPVTTSNVEIRGLGHHDNTNTNYFVMVNANNAIGGQSNVWATSVRSGLFDASVENEKSPAVLRQFNSTVTA